MLPFQLFLLHAGRGRPAGPCHSPCCCIETELKYPPFSSIVWVKRLLGYDNPKVSAVCSANFKLWKAFSA